jgi:hypothetical protein
MSKSSNTIKIETLLASLGPEYKPMLAGLDASGSTAYSDVVAKLKKVEVRLKIGLQGLQGQNLARRIFAGNTNGFNRPRTRKEICYYYSKPGYFKKECKKLQVEQRSC